MNSLPVITDIEETLLGIDAMMGAAEAHGALCGILCARGSIDLSDWVGQVLGDQAQGSNMLQDVVQQLSDLHQTTLAQLNDSMVEFDLLLPDDNDDLSERVAALASWCQGYVYGLAAGGLTEESKLPEDSRELLGDIIEISRADLDDENMSKTEENEAAFMEISEYVRMGVLLINEELQPLQTTKTVH